MAGLDSDVVYSISGGDSEIWVGRQRGGLTVLTKNGDSFVARTYTQADGLAQNSVYSVHRDRDRTIWAGTVSAGVSRLSGGKYSKFLGPPGLPPKRVNTLLEGFDGEKWGCSPPAFALFGQRNCGK